MVGAAVILSLLIAGSARCASVPFPLAGCIATNATVSGNPSPLNVTFKPDADWPNIKFNAPQGTAWDWSGDAAIVFDIQNPTSKDVDFYVQVDDVAADGSRHTAKGQQTAPAHTTTRFYFQLMKGYGSDRTGMRWPPALPEASGAVGLNPSGALDDSHIVSLQVFRAKSREPATLILQSIDLIPRPSSYGLAGIIDKYGQYTGADWPGKIHSDADFAAQLAAEVEDNRSHRGPLGRDKWGGWADGPKLNATGFFRTQQLDGRWWLVDPDGRLFLSVGVTCVRLGDPTVVEKRESMFTWLPAGADRLASNYVPTTYNPIAGPLYSGKSFNFYGANAQRKYGASPTAAWSDMSTSRLESWGFNTIANWSDDAFVGRDKIPYVIPIGIRNVFARAPAGHDYWGPMPDPFDPAFAAEVDHQVAYRTGQVKSDPWCIGFFLQNELSWGGGDSDRRHYGLAYGALAASETSPEKMAFIASLKSKYASIDRLNAAWGTSFADWSALNASYAAPAPLPNDAMRVDFSAFLTAFAEKYFGVVAATIRRYDTNHLYLGCRFADFSPEAVAVAAKYADVISFNIYSWNKQRYAFAETLGKPIIIGEFHFGAVDRGMFGGGLMPVRNQEERASRYADYVKTVLSEPAFVGCHWFQYTDDPTTGRSGDGENFNIGFVSITDTPYPELIAAARNVNSRVYDIHNASPTIQTIKHGP